MSNIIMFFQDKIKGIIYIFRKVLLKIDALILLSLVIVPKLLPHIPYNAFHLLHLYMSRVIMKNILSIAI